MGPLVVSLAATLLGIQVATDPGCPSRGAVEQALAAFENSEAPAQELVAQIDRLDAGLRLRLLDGNGGLLGERLLPYGGTCDELAHASAVVLTSWEVLFVQGLRQIVRGSLGEPPSPELELPPPPPSKVQLEAGLGVFGIYAPTTDSFGLELSAAVGPHAGSWAVTGSLLFDGPQQALLGPGVVTWNRSAVGLGGAFRLARRGWRLDLEAQLMLALVDVTGSEFSANSTAVGLDAGGKLGARLVWMRWPIAPWVGLQGVGWFGGNRAYLAGSTATVSLSGLELWGGAGILCRFR